MSRSFLLILGMAAICACAAALPPDVAVTIQRLHEDGERGDGKALFHLSTLYERGYDSIPADTVRSLRYLRRAADTGYAPAENYLGYLMYEGKMIPEQRDSALYWLDRAASHGDAKAASNLGFLLLNDTRAGQADSLKNAEKAAGYLEMAAKAQLPSAVAQLADLYRTGHGVPADTTRAESLYLEASALGFDGAERKLLNMMRYAYEKLTPDEAVKKGIEAANAGADAVALKLYEQAASHNHPKAMTLVGDALSSAKGTAYDHDGATLNYFRGALGGDPSAQFILAELLEIFPDALNGILSDSEVPENLFPVLVSPEFWYKEASSQGVDDAREAIRRLRSSD